MRKHLAWYCHAIPKAAELRRRLVRVNNLADVTECLGSYAAEAAENFDFPARACRTGRSAGLPL
jgi:hypothetical protein